ncbi:MAG: alpha/beta fold hydrolase [Acidimicrobiales bacterium]
MNVDVVFLHGWLMGPDLWTQQVAALDGIAAAHPLPAPAHGAPAPAGGFDMAAWAAGVIEELDRRNVGRAVFVGHSMGGFLAQQIWRDHPARVAGIGLIGITEQPATAEDRAQFIDLNERIARDWRAMAEIVRPLLVGDQLVSSQPDWVDRWIERVERDYDLAGMVPLAAAVTARPDYTPTTSQIDVPTVVVHGTDDRAIPVGFGRRLAALIPGAELSVLDDCGHAAPLEQPAAVSKALRSLIGRVAADPTSESAISRAGLV